jgi:hypothetical protein
MSLPLNLFPFNAVLSWGTAGNSMEPYQGSRVVAESQELCDLLEKPELCMRVHCFDAGPDTRFFGLWQHVASLSHLRT